MTPLNQLVPFRLDEQWCALDLWVVRRIVLVVEVTRLPKSPEIVLGVVIVQGEVIPVLNVRRRFGLPERRTNLSDRLIIARTARRTVALLVDSVGGVVERPAQEVTGAANIVPGAEYLEGITKLDGEILFVQNLDRFLSLEEEKQLNDAQTKS